MTKKHVEIPAPMPKRKELSDTPVKLCCEISRIFRAKLRESSQSEGVMSQPGAGLVLSLLATGDGISQKELVDATHLRAPSISAILKKMSDEGIVTIERDKNDMRVIRIYLTDYGREIDAERIARVKESDAIAHASLTDEEMQTLMLLLSKIRADLLADREKDKEKKGE